MESTFEFSLGATACILVRRHAEIESASGFQLGATLKLNPRLDVLRRHV